MEEIKDSLYEFWEVLTGVFDDKKSTIIRLVCFGILFLGGLWATLAYFRANTIANTSKEFENPNPRLIPAREDTNSINQIANMAQTLGQLKNGGEAIAASLALINTKPFNVEGYNEMGLENLDSSHTPQTSTTTPSGSTSTQSAQVLFVKAVMMTGKTGTAVVDMGTRKGVIIKTGDKLPDGAGLVTGITTKGVTVVFNSEKYVYEVSDNTPKVEGIK